MDVITELVDGARIVLCVEPDEGGYGWHIEVRRDNGELVVIRRPSASYPSDAIAVRVGVFALVQAVRDYIGDGSGRAKGGSVAKA
jgi:hypothetical protein